jgi:hypothetical protein
VPDSTELLSLNCFVDSDQPNQRFSVEVLKTKDIGILDLKIIEEESPIASKTSMPQISRCFWSPNHSSCFQAAAN